MADDVDRALDFFAELDRKLGLDDICVVRCAHCQCYVIVPSDMQPPWYCAPCGAGPHG